MANNLINKVPRKALFGGFPGEKSEKIALVELQSDWNDLGSWQSLYNIKTKDENGNDVCVFHARTYLEIVGDPLYDPNRHAMLMNVTWDEKGYPVFDYTNMVKF